MKLQDLQLTTPYLQLAELFYDEVAITPLKNPFMIALSEDAVKLLGLDEPIEKSFLLDVMNGTRTLRGEKTFAMCYAGHQFGYFVPRLGDGRTINLGKANGWNLQLKGSGQTLYSRQGDGRAVLRSSIREFLMSEAMHGLGIATSRALALMGSESDVARERWEKGAMVLRLSPTWVRFGTFEYFSALGEYAKLQELADYVIDESFSDLKGSEGIYLKMYTQIVKNTASTIAKWQSVGFNHGVMNTDNMCIDGRTIDYGPFAFLDNYDKHYICNHTDREGRYSFASQVGIAYWNLDMLARSLSPLANYILSEEVLDDNFRTTYEYEYLEIMYAKMGLYTQEADDKELFEGMMAALQDATIDYTLFFRKLSRYDGKKSDILDICIDRRSIQEWLNAYDLRLKKERLSTSQRHKKMLAVNPKYILRNYILQEAIEKAQENDFDMVEDLLKVALDPFEEHEEYEYLSKAAPQESKNIKLSCSS